jgi:hypothetical protein
MFRVPCPSLRGHVLDGACSQNHPQEDLGVPQEGATKVASLSSQLAGYADPAKGSRYGNFWVYFGFRETQPRVPMYIGMPHEILGCLWPSRPRLGEPKSELFPETEMHPKSFEASDRPRSPVYNAFTGPHVGTAKTRLRGWPG